MHVGCRAVFAACAILCLGPLTGCRTAGARSQVANAYPIEAKATENALSDVQARAERAPAVIQQAAHAQSLPEEIDAPRPEVLDIDALVAEVLVVNPDIRAAAAAWRAASQRYPQEIALDDPMFGYMLGPGSWGRNDVNDAYTVEASQKLPWSGKRQLRGDIAQAEANAAYFDVGEQRLQIAETTRLAYYEYFLAHRQLAVLAESTRLLEDFRQIALSRYESASVEQQDVLLADVELADLSRRQFELERKERVARARLNTLLLVAADAPLPPPPVELSLVGGPTDPAALRALALAQRPELSAQAARIRAEQYAVRLAYKEFYPDVEVLARYDAFWQEEPLRPMIGMNVNVPLGKKKRWAAVNEARARVAKEQAELETKTNELMFDVEQTMRLVEESQGSLSVYRERILPAVRHSVDAARASYVAGRLDFLRLVASQRQLLEMQDRYYEVMADYRKREAALRRLVGEPPAASIEPLEDEATF